jgi:hypothetical protein
VQNNVGGQIPAAVTPPYQMRPWARTTDEPVTLNPGQMIRGTAE